MTDINIKHLISPFALWLPHTPPIAHKAMTRPMCNCDSDEENDFGMKHPTKKRRSQTRATRTRTKRIGK